ncbi:thioredoxin family protein [Micromonospora sp. WMMD736]|uniref:thioredoxin family protein n=1 Tax=Micromonospora sp. WMMD736 TaxID=3404112 RepID=UPI003B954A3A
MSTTVVVVIAVLIAVAGVALIAGRLIALRARLRKGEAAAANVDTTGLDLSSDGPTVVHFSAPWCQPCAGVRRTVEEVCAQLPAVAHLEVDVDDQPELARRLSVLSLPTTLIFDATGRPRYRTTNVLKPADLRAVLEPLLA